ncbi:hydroxymethylbilane synthase [Malassezia sp. CBS 17886]|nr:hydroxymethylbilane synthase [Malassezia sp. CBS 17886]
MSQERVAASMSREAAAPADADTEPVCPVPHAETQPLPPGHPPVPMGQPSSLQPPVSEHCIFFRTSDDAVPTPPRQSPPPEGRVLESAGVSVDTASPTSADSVLVLSSRTSQLAVAQAQVVQRLLESLYGPGARAFSEVADGHADAARALLRRYMPHAAADTAPTPMSFPARTMATAGDANLRSPLYVIGGEGRAIWTKELEVALESHAVDAIVHSLKDVPTTLPEGLELAAVTTREDPRDALVVKEGLPYKSLADMPRGSVIGTSSVRRVALLRRSFPHLVFSDVRGNIHTRLTKLDADTGPYTALVLAAAGLKRVGVDGRITAYLDAPAMLYAVGQGALAVEVRVPRGKARARDERVRALIASISDWRTMWRCAAERALLHRMQGGCSIPLGVATSINGEKEAQREGDVGMRQHEDVPSPDAPEQGAVLTLRAVIVSMDGQRSCDHEESALCQSVEDVQALGFRVADELEHSQGARAILEEVERHRKMAEEVDARRRAARKRMAAGASGAECAVRGEVDRRGVPRDDGQAKVWEV